MNDQQLLRYSRHILLPEVDIDGQQSLLDSTALVVGLGGLGCPVALYLASSGVGHLILVDDDQVDVSNLQRQIAHGTRDLGKSKVASAAESIRAINPDINLTLIEQRLEGDALAQQVSLASVVLDCCDNFSTRFAINAACVAAKKPLISGAAIRLEGQLTVFDTRRDDSPCYRCLYTGDENLDLSCSESGVLAPLVGVIGAAQAMEAVKCLADVGEPAIGRLQLFDAKQFQWREFSLNKDPACPVCGVN